MEHEDGAPERPPTDRASLTAAVALVGVAVVAAWFDLKTNALLPEGTPAPALVATRLDGQRVSLDDLRGKVVLVNFWATWCAPCKAELPGLVQLARELAPRGVVLLAVNQDDPEGQAEAVRSFAASLPGLEPSVVLGTPGHGGAYLVRMLPTLYVLGRDGTVKRAFAGTAAMWQVSQWVESAL